MTHITRNSRASDDRLLTWLALRMDHSAFPPLTGDRDRDGFAAKVKGRWPRVTMAASQTPGALTECATSDDRAGDATTRTACRASEYPSHGHRPR